MRPGSAAGQRGSEFSAATRQLGQGPVYAFTTPALFDNENLAENGNREVLLSLLARHS